MNKLDKLTTNHNDLKDDIQALREHLRCFDKRLQKESGNWMPMKWYDISKEIDNLFRRIGMLEAKQDGMKITIASLMEGN
jgi:hypothetical protein